jgi:hypothetical protein
MWERVKFRHGLALAPEGEVLQVQGVRQGLQQLLGLPLAPEVPHRSEALQMQPMLKNFQL